MKAEDSAKAASVADDAGASADESENVPVTTEEQGKPSDEKESEV